MSTQTAERAGGQQGSMAWTGSSGQLPVLGGGGDPAQPCACGELMYSAASAPPGSLSAPKACEVPRNPGGTCSLGTGPVLSEPLERAVLPGAETQPVGSYDMAGLRLWQ